MDVNIEKKLLNQDKMINKKEMILLNLDHLFFNKKEKEDEKIIKMDDQKKDHPLNFLVPGPGFLIVFFYLFLLVLFFLYGGGGEVGPEPAPPSKNKKKLLLGFQQQKS